MNRHRKVVYIDADPIYRRTMESDLDHGVYSCRLCVSGSEGLEAIAGDPPDVVVVDYTLNDMTGEELYIRFLGDPRCQAFRDIPFIVLTKNGKVSRSHLYSLGFSACLSKPFSRAAFLEFVEDVIVSHQIKMEEIYCWETIREAKDFLERVVESSADGMVTTNTRGFITYCNRAAEETLGHHFEELIGKRVSDILTNGNSELLKINALLRKRNKVQNYKVAISHRNGRTVLVNLSISVMKDGNGKPMGTLSICKQIDDEDFSEFDKNESDRVTAVVETAVAVNHAINNPLVPILGNAQFLLQDSRMIDEDLRRRLRIIVKNALRIRDITQKLANIQHPVTKEYLKGTRMLDIDAST